MSSIQSSIVQSPTSKSTGPQRGPAVTVSGTVRQNLPVSQPKVTININVSRPLPPQGTSIATSTNLSASVNVKNSNSETLNTCMSKSTVSSSSKDNDNIMATTSGSNPTSQNELISSSTQRLATNAKTSTSIIKPRYEIMSHSYRLPNNSPQSKCGPMLSGPRGPMLSEPRGPMPAKISQHDTTPHIQPDFQYSVAHNTQSPITYTTVNSTTSEEKIDNSEDEEEDSDEEVDTGYCQFCNVTFTNPDVSSLLNL